MNVKKQLNSQKGIASLELLFVIWIWMFAVAFLVDIVLIFGNAVDLQAALNRSALAASAQGCISPESRNQVEGLRTFLVSNVQLKAVQVARSASGFNRAAAVAAVSQGQNNANCLSNNNGLSQGLDVVPQSDYIFIDLQYNQHLFIFPSIHVHKTALAISSSFNLEGNN